MGVLRMFSKIFGYTKIVYIRGIFWFVIKGIHEGIFISQWWAVRPLRSRRVMDMMIAVVLFILVEIRYKNERKTGGK